MKETQEIQWTGQAREKHPAAPSYIKRTYCEQTRSLARETRRDETYQTDEQNGVIKKGTQRRTPGPCRIDDEDRKSRKRSNEQVDRRDMFQMP